MQDHSGRDITPRLEKAVLSIRNVLDVIRKWNKGKEMDLDWALWEGFISGQPNPDDKNLLIKMAHDCGFFQESDGYNPIITKGYGDGETTEEELRDMSSSYYYYPDEKELIDMPEVIEAVYGEIPDRRVWPRADMLNEYDDEVPEEDYKRCDEMRESVKKSVQLLEVLAEQCGCDKEEA